MDKLIIMEEKVNKKNITLTEQELKEAYQEIQHACTGSFKTIAGNRDVKKIKEILKKYFNPENPILSIDAEIGNTSFTPLMTSAWLNVEEALVELLKLGADPKYSKNNTNSPIHIAVTNDRQLLVYHLLTVDPTLANFQNAQGQTPFMLAIEAGHLNLVKILLEKYNADGHIQDNKGQSAIDYAQKNKRQAIESYLMYFKLDKSLDNRREHAKSNKI